MSERTAQRLSELCAPTGRVFVVPHGVDHDRFRPEAGSSPEGPRPQAATDHQHLERLGVRPPYVLFLGTLEPRKAVPDLVAAFDRVADPHGAHAGVSLVLAGQPGWGTEAVQRAIGEAKAAGRIVCTGYVPDDAVPALLRHAAVAAYPALEEGFGLPALEALAVAPLSSPRRGRPWPRSPIGAAVLVTPGSVPELAAALDGVLRGGAEVQERRRLGFAVAGAHTWEASAAHHLSAYRWAGAAGRPHGARRPLPR